MQQPTIKKLNKAPVAPAACTVPLTVNERGREGSVD